MSYNKGQSINNKCTTAHAKGSRYGRRKRKKRQSKRKEKMPPLIN